MAFTVEDRFMDALAVEVLKEGHEARVDLGWVSFRTLEDVAKDTPGNGLIREDQVLGHLDLVCGHPEKGT